MYVGNYDGILVYDGSDWDLVTTPSKTTVRSLAADKRGHVFVGLQGDFGYIAADSLGNMQYESLAEQMVDQIGAFRDVWNTHVLDDEVYFQTKTYLISWKGDSFEVWESESGFHTSFLVDGSLYVRENGVGLLRLDGDDLHRVPGGERFAHTQIFMVERHPSGGLLIATQREGLFHLESGQATPFESEIAAWMETHRLYHGESIPGGFYALAFLDGGGLMIINTAGELIDSFNESTGIPDGWINHVFVDKQRGLWLALNNRGILRLDAVSGLTKYDERNGLDGVINDIYRSDDRLYVATSTGLYHLNKGTSHGERAKFSRVNSVRPTTSIQPVEYGFLAATHGGVFHIRDDDINAEEVIPGSFFSVRRSDLNPKHVYLGSKSGLSVATFDGLAWEYIADVALLNKEVLSIAEDSDGHIWVSTRGNDVYRINITDSWEVKSIQKYVTDDDQVHGQLSLSTFNGDVAVVAANGLYIPDIGSDSRRLRFVPYASNGGAGSDTLLSFKLFGSDLWKVFPDRVEVAQLTDKRYTAISPSPLQKLAWRQPVRLNIDSSGVAWISSGSTLIRYDASFGAERTYEAPFPPIIRRITNIDSNRQLFGGAFTTQEGRLSSVQDASLIPELTFEENALRFEFSLPSYNDVAGNEFQYLLEGKDKDWSSWTSETIKNYTNLSEGTYRFRLRGRNAQGAVAPASVYTFTVLPPWYRSSWAYGVYLIALFGLALFVRQHRRMVVENRKAKEQAKELAKEREINERLNDLNRRLKQANESLLQADRLKDEFLANTSHELRTPLTGILGCAAILSEEVSEDHQEFVAMIDQNGHRLLHTLDSLLELARLRAGLLELEYVKIDVGSIAGTVASSYRSVLEKKDVMLEIDVEGDVTADLDEHCLECVLNHLIGNAVKFTDEGRINVSVKREEDRILLAVTDTGIGIDESFLPFLFDEFKQESTGLTRSHEGNGLGLAVTARIVDLMGGEIEVESRKGEGSTFRAYFPATRSEFARSGDGHAAGSPNIHVGAAAGEQDRAAA